jgi:agmatinase
MTPESLTGTPTLVGVPYDGSSSYETGAALAPPLIRDALASTASNPWSENGVDLAAHGVLADDGDLFLDDGPETRARIESAIDDILGRGGRPIALGGDHSITYPILRAVRRRHPRLTIVQFDAHPDLYDEYEGDRYSHACPFARIMEEKLTDRLVQVGIRAITGHGREQAAKFGVEIVPMRDVDATRIALTGPVYLSIDLDVLDPAFAMGVAHREPGGMSVRQLLRLIQDLAVPIVGADLVELNPRFDASGESALVCAKILKELVGRMVT